MSRYQATLSANAGIALQLGSAHVLVDALHNEKIAPFSPVSKQLWETMQDHPSFAAPDLLIFTHCHPDHFSWEMVRQAKLLWPDAKVILPENLFEDQILLTGMAMDLDLKALRFHFFRLRHDGEGFGSVKNYGFLVTDGTFQALITGDCQIGDPILESQIEGEKIDAAFLNFPWVTLRRGREILNQMTNLRHLVVYHLPFLEDDLYDYQKAAERALPRLRIASTLLTEPLQSILFDVGPCP